MPSSSAHPAPLKPGDQLWNGEQGLVGGIKQRIMNGLGRRDAVGKQSAKALLMISGVKLEPGLAANSGANTRTTWYESNV
jgi:hypothetical protein